MKIKTITAAALAAAALLAPAAAEASPSVTCAWGVVRDASCTALDRRMARQLATKAFRRIDADWNTGQADSVHCSVVRAPRIWACVVVFTDGNGEALLVQANIRRRGGVRVTGVCRSVTDAPGCLVRA